MIALGNILLNWKEFNVNLDKVFSAIKLIDENFCGISANSSLTIHGVEEFSPEVTSLIQTYWDGITTESEEAKKYFSAEQYSAALEAKKLELETKDLSAWTVVDRKVFMGRVVTAEELGII